MLSSGASPGIKCAGANERKGFRGAHEGRADGIRWSRVGLRGPAHPVLPLPGRSRNRSGLFTNPAFLDFVSAPVDYLVRKGLKRGWATLFVLGSLALVFVLAVLALAPMVTEQARQPVAALPGFLESTQELAGELESALGFKVDLRPDPQELWDPARNYLSGHTVSTAVGVGVADVLSMGAVVLITTAYIVARPVPLINGFVALFPADGRGCGRSLGEVYKSGQRWFLGQLAYMAIIGSLFALA